MCARAAEQHNLKIVVTHIRGFLFLFHSSLKVHKTTLYMIYSRYGVNRHCTAAENTHTHTRLKPATRLKTYHQTSIMGM